MTKSPPSYDLDDLLSTLYPDPGYTSLADLQAEHAAWAGRNFPDAEPWEPLVGATEELGELAHAHLKGHQGIRHAPDEIETKKADAVGDILVYLAHYCTLNGLSLQGCLDLAWGEVRDRDIDAQREAARRTEDAGWGEEDC